MTNNYDVICTIDKAKRDDIFRQMRASTDPLERASVKFSGNEPILAESGLQGGDFIRYSKNGRKQFRLAFVSNWSVATPRT